jgi:hypothetical protein
MTVNAGFLPNVVTASIGKTVQISATLSPGTVATFPAGTTHLLATWLVPAGTAAYMRISTESSTAIQATTSIAGASADTPLWGNGITSPITKLFATAGGTSSPTTVAIAATVTASPVVVYLTPGTGGFGP